MRFDYDLVIIGGAMPLVRGIAARQAALTAAQWNARVALVESPETQSWGDTMGIHQALLHLGQRVRLLHQARSTGVYSGSCSDFSSTRSSKETLQPTLNWAEALDWAGSIVENLNEERSLPFLASQGVDVIVGSGEFCRRPKLGFVVNGRVLRSRRYLIVVGSCPMMPPIKGLADANALTLSGLWRSLPTLKPNAHLIIIGANSTGIELAQILTRGGFRVTLLSNRDRLLPQEDGDAVRLIQAQLEAEGVQILTHAEVTQVRRLGDQTWVQVGTRALEADEVIVTTTASLRVESLNLAAVQVSTSSNGIQVNSKLQTTNPRIYACGEATNGYPFDHITQYEAEIAVKNALFFPRCQVNYHHMPWMVATDPALARIGLTETQARRTYGDRLSIIHQPLKRVAKAQLQGDITGFCKLIVCPNGQIIGAHIVSPEAEELIAAIALLMRHKHPLQTLAAFPAIHPSLAEVLHLAALEWRQHRSDRNPFWRELRETWFNWRRS